MTGRAPLRKPVFIPVTATPAGGNESNTARVPFAGRVTAVTYVPDGTVTGAATNHRRVALVNRGQAGTGTAELAALAFDAPTVTAPAYDERTVPLVGTEASRDVAEGDLLDFRSTPVGTGIADPGGMAVITLERL